ncbi:MAG: sulfatase, partial [Planctomycetes bacterium]|nr:sulfatase [Planctomycetota bacterium]
MATSSPGPGRRLPVAALALVPLAMAAAAVWGALRADGPGGGAGAPARPDILLFVWDTCRGDRVSAHGYERETTPLLTALAAEGVSYRRCFTPAPWTPPAHASLFTGLLPRRHGLLEGMGDRMKPGLRALPETLQRAGYETVCIAANALISEVTGLDAGFAREYPCYRTDDDTVTGEDALLRAREWLEERRARGGPRRPLFLFVNLMDTHLPYVRDDAAVAATHGGAARERAGRAASLVGDLEAKMHLMGARLLPEEIVRDLGVAYDGAVRRTDRITGSMLDLLAAEGIGGDALVIVTGDHGENLGEHGEMNHAFSVHETVCRVPLVVRRKGSFEGGIVVEAPVALQDLYPTILDAAGLPPEPGCGLDAVPLTTAPAPRVIVSEYGPMPRSFAEARVAMAGAPPEALARFGWRYVAAREWSAEGGGRTYVRVEGRDGEGRPILVRESLFDPVADPGEERDLLGPAALPADRAAAAVETVSAFVDAQRSAGRFVPSSQLLINGDGF